MGAARVFSDVAGGRAAGGLYEGPVEGGERVEAAHLGHFGQRAAVTRREQGAGLLHAEGVDVFVESGVQMTVEVVGEVGAVGADRGSRFGQREAGIEEQAVVLHAGAEPSGEGTDLFRRRVGAAAFRGGEYLQRAGLYDHGVFAGEAVDQHPDHHGDRVVGRVAEPARPPDQKRPERQADEQRHDHLANPGDAQVVDLGEVVLDVVVVPRAGQKDDDHDREAEQGCVDERRRIEPRAGKEGVGGQQQGRGQDHGRRAERIDPAGRDDLEHEEGHDRYVEHVQTGDQIRHVGNCPYAGYEEADVLQLQEREEDHAPVENFHHGTASAERTEPEAGAHEKHEGGSVDEVGKIL